MNVKKKVQAKSGEYSQIKSSQVKTFFVESSQVKMTRPLEELKSSQLENNNA